MKKAVLPLVIFPIFFTYGQEKPKNDSLSTQSIGEVTLTKKVFQKKADRLIYDVASSPIAKGNTAFGLLKETPLVSSTDDKTLKIAGKNNAVVFINGRKTEMNAEALENFLKSTPAENIQKIEVITLPGSEFNVESSDGIINIILKKRKEDGINGNLRLTDTQAKKNSNSVGASMDFRKQKWGGNANFSVRNQFNNQNYTLKNGNATNTGTSVGSVDTKDESFGGYLNLDYALAEKQNIAMSYTVWRSKSPFLQAKFFNTIDFKDSNNQWQKAYTSSSNFGNEDDINQSVNLNYEAKMDDEGSKLNVNAAYLHYEKSSMSDAKTFISDEQQNLLSLQSQFMQKAPQKISNYSATIDYSKVFKKWTLSAGGNYNTTKTDNDTYFETRKSFDDPFVKDPNQSNHFVYDESIAGLYMNAEKNFTDKFSAKIGARLEYSTSFGEILDSSIDIKRKYTNFLPALNVSYAINDNHSLSLGVTSRIRRPSFWEINPVRIYLTESNYVQNNPFMKASTVYNQEFMYMYKNTYFLQIQDTYTQDAITQVPLQKVVNGVNTIRYIRTNYGSENTFATNLGFNKSFFKQIWSSNMVVGLLVKSFNGMVDRDPITNENLDAFVFDFTLASPLIQSNNNIRLAKDKSLFLGVNYFFLGKSRENLGTVDPIQQLNLSLKKIWKNWTFLLDLQDVLDTNKIRINDQQKSGNFNTIYQYSYNRRGSISITYNFGNQKIQKIRSIKNAADDIKQRTGN